MVVVRGREVCDMCHVSGHYRKSVYNMSHLPVFILVESDSRGILTGHKYQVVVVMVKVMHPNSPSNRSHETYREHWKSESYEEEEWRMQGKGQKR